MDLLAPYTCLLRRQPTLRPDDTHHILISNQMRQPDPLRQMLRTSTPNKRILETIFQRPVNRVAHILNITALPHNQRFVERWLDAFALRVDAHELQLFPAALDDFFNAEVQLAGHYRGVVFAGEGVEVLEADAVDFVVDVEAFNVGSVVFHDDVDELVDGCWEEFVS